jgi:hypothetical protein
MNQYNFDITVGANTYAGELAAPYVTAALLGAETIAKSRARLIEGVTSKAVVNTVTSANPIIAATCAPSEGSNVTLGEQVATLSDLQVYESICRKTIFPTWVAAQGKMKRNGDIPPEFTDFLLSVVASKAGEQLESLLWSGDSGAVFGLGFLSNDGVIDEAGIDASACKDFVEADTGATAWAKGNILDVFGGVYDKVMTKPAIANKPGFGFYCSYEAYGFYLQALATSGSNQGINTLGTNQAFNTVTYMGYPVYPTSGIPNTVDVMVATYPDNLVIATNNFTGNTQAELIPRYKYDGKDSVIVSMNFAVGLNVAVPDDGVVGFDFT